MSSAPVFHMEMSLSRTEFLRGLARLANEMESFSRKSASEWELCMASQCVRITFQELLPRRAGALVLPRACITLDMHHLPPQEREAFLNLFRRIFQRGGG